MAALDWSQCPAVESVPDRVGGAWVFKGTRLPVATVIENLEDLSVDEVMEQFEVSRDQVAAVLEFVAESLRTAAPASARAVWPRHAEGSGPGAAALVVLTGSTKWSLVRQQAARIAAAVSSATAGSYAEVDVPLPPRPRRS